MRTIGFVLSVVMLTATSALAQTLTLPGRRARARPCSTARTPAAQPTSSPAAARSSSRRPSRTYFLDYPCDLKRGEKVTFILSLHGGGSYGNWQRHYFPLLDYTDKYRLVVATPFSPRRVWSAEDDGYLQNIVSSVIDAIGRENIKAFWLAGHSQGGLTSIEDHLQRLLRDESRWVPESVRRPRRRSGGRATSFGIPAQAGAPPDAQRLPPGPRRRAHW